MPISRARSITRTVCASLALACIVVGVPVLLGALARWPLPQKVPDLGSVWTRLQQGDIPAESVVKSLAVIVWLIWLQLTWAIAWEIVVNLRRVSERRPPTRPPLVPAPVSAGMGRLVAMIFSATVAVASLPAPSLAAPGPASNAVAAPVRAPVAADTTEPEATDIAETCWVVHSNDTLWRIAETALGDGARSDEILDLNSDLRSPRDIRQGQRLRLPSDATIPADRQAAAPESLRSPVEDAFVAESIVVIEPGDTLWDLSTERLTLADPAGPDAPEIVDYVHRVVDRNPDVVEDPDMILPGEVFVMPTIGTPPEPEPLPPPPEPVVADPSETLPVSTEVVTTSGPPTTPFPTLPVEPTNGATPDVSTPPLVRVSGSNTADFPGQTGPATQVDGESGFPWTIAAGASTALASGLLMLLRRRRRLACSRGVRAAEPTEEHRILEAELVRAADVPLLTWARHELTALFADPELPTVKGVPVVVEISDTAGIEMLWSRQNPSAPRPWESSDDGWTWRATYDSNIEIPANSDATPLPGLVTVGQRDGRNLLLNLESFGTLDLVGDPDAVLDLARSMVAELSTDHILADTYIHVVDGLFADLPETARHLPIDAERAKSLIANTIEEHHRLLSDAELGSTFDLRKSAGAAGREMVVVVVPDGPGGDELREATLADRGVALIVVGATTRSQTELSVSADGRAELRPLGLSFDAAALPGAAVTRLTDLLEHDVDAEPVVPDEIEELEVDDGGQRFPLDEPSPVHADDVDHFDEAPKPPEVLVSVLGRPNVTAFPKLGRMDTNLVVFLATNGGSATDDQLIDAVWNGRMVEQGTVWNRISKVRSVLGSLLPAREPGAARIVLARSVRTDLDYFTDLVRFADDGSSDEAIRLLAEALDLVVGPPFDAPGYDWAHQHQYHSRACDLIESTAVRLVDLALDAGAIEAARRGVAQALRALPANEPLYRARMRLEAAADNLSGVASAFDELACVLAEMSDDGLDFEPSPRTVRLRADLLDTSSVRSA